MRIFFIAFEKVMRSCDYGQSWEEVTGPECAFQTNDPYGWVDPVTDRIFNVQMQGLETSWICWSDDDGESWLGNPHDSGTTPLSDHIKLATGPWTSNGYGIGGTISQTFYDQAVYYCYNKGIGIFCFTSFDGGATFEAGGQIYGLASSNGGLHGAITSAPDGTVYVTPRVETPTVIVSKDNGLSWDEYTMGGCWNALSSKELGDRDRRFIQCISPLDRSRRGVYMSRSIDSERVGSRLVSG